MPRRPIAAAALLLTLNALPLQAQPLEVDADAYAHYASFDQLCVAPGRRGARVAWRG